MATDLMLPFEGLRLSALSIKGSAIRLAQGVVQGGKDGSKDGVVGIFPVIVREGSPPGEMRGQRPSKDEFRAKLE